MKTSPDAVRGFDKREVNFKLADLSPRLERDGTLTINVPVYPLEGPVVNERVQEQLRERGFTDREMDELYDSVIEAIEEVQIRKIFTSRRA